MNSRRDGLKQSYLPCVFFFGLFEPFRSGGGGKIRVRDNVIEGLRTAALKYKAQVTSASRSSRPVSPAPERAPAKKQKLAAELANDPLPPGLVSRGAPEEKTKKLAAEAVAKPRPTSAKGVYVD